MRRLVLLATVLALLLPTAATALAQQPGEKHARAKTMTTGALAQPAGGSPVPDPPRYAFRADGTVVIDGDVFTDCSSFASSLDRGGGFRGDAGQARSVLKRCEEAGLLPSGGTTSSASASAASASSVPAGASASSATPAANGEGGELPDTGGPSLPALLVVSSLVVMTSGLLVRKAAG